MLFVWIVLWTTSALMLMMNRRNASMRWLSLVAFCGGMGALAATIGDVLRPYLMAQEPTSTVRDLWLYRMQLICSWTSYYGLPYAYLRFTAAYHSQLLPERLRTRLLYLAAIPPLVMLLLRPETTEFPVRYPLLALWALPYFAVGTIILLMKNVNTRSEWRSHGILLAAVVPAVLFACAMNYVLPLFGVYGMWRYNIWPIAIAFILFVTSLFTFGFLGVQLLIERRQLDSSIRIITSGTSILNHAIKNDLGKMKLFADKILRQAEEQGNAELQQDIKVMMTASDHIEQMIRKVHERTQELKLVPERLRLSELVLGCLAEIQPAVEGNIAVRTELDVQAEIIADRVQTMEAIRNVIQNALDAMKEQGELTVRIQSTRRESIVEIRDTGPGIPKQHLRKVFEPFYTTKGGATMNFGLGLAYCYHLMKRQGGSMQISSRLGEGTVVAFHFPKAS